MSLFEGNRDTVSWNDIALTDKYKLYVVDVDISDSNKFGVTRSVNMINNKFISTEDEIFSIDITFITSDYIDIAEWEDGYLDTVSKVLFKYKDPKILKVGNKIYYGLFVDGSINKINDRGYFTVTFQSVKPTAFENIEKIECYIESNKKIYIGNSGLYDTYADITINCIKAGRITLLNNNCKLEVVMNTNEILKIYGDSREVIYDGDINYDSDVLKLVTDINEFNITTTGKFEVTFEYQPELPLI